MNKERVWVNKGTYLVPIDVCSICKRETCECNENAMVEAIVKAKKELKEGI